VLANQAHQFGSITGLSDDLIPALLEQARETLAHQDVVLSDNDPRADLISVRHFASMPRSEKPIQTF
jgi:hypothetical protein